MEQKDYKFEIMNILINGENHIRGIADKLNINHMMIVRKVNELLNSNVVDVVKEGRNQVYSVKNSVEARAYFLMTEQYKLVYFLKEYPFLRNIVNKIQRDKRIKIALIFGSYAKGLVRKSSDIDIFIEGQNINIKQEYSKLDSKFAIKIGKWNKGDILIQEIKKNHILIKGGEKYYEKIFT